MATYDSYKKLNADQIPNNVFSDASLQFGAGNNYGVLWVKSNRAQACGACANNGDCCCQACGQCCQWTVPANTSKVTFEIWSGGGGGTGNTCCGCCTHSIGGAGGNYAIKTVSTTPGCTYTVCAGGSYRCEKRHNCTGGMGCRSYVNGYNLSNFCTHGGCPGWMCNGDAWGPTTNSAQCANCGICGIFGSDFGIMGSVGGRFGQGYHHCMHKTVYTGQAPFWGGQHGAGPGDTTCMCGCYVNWPSGGGQSGVSACYDSDAQICCAGGMGMGGSGIVKITFS